MAKIRKGKAWSLPKKKEKTLDELVKGKPDEAFVPYNSRMRYEKGALLVHTEHGRGVVTKVLSTMYIEILFASGKATFEHKGW